MELLKTLEALRTPAGDAFFLTVTRLGEEHAFMALVLLMLWCIDKRWGYRLFYAGMLGNVLNQLLKAVLLVPRPWLRDPSLTVVEGARLGATGHSFPSGHTQTATTLSFTLARPLRRWAWLGAGLATGLVAFSRLYLGVHTPADVLAGLALGLLVAFALGRMFCRAEQDKRLERGLWLGLAAFALAQLLYMALGPGRAESNLDGLKNAYAMTGVLAGFLLMRWLDEKYLRYPIHGVWWAQALKLLLGLALVLGVQVGLKPPLTRLFGGSPAESLLRYFAIAVTAAGVWPLTFRFWAKLGQRTRGPVKEG